MEAPKCRTCGERHFGLCSDAKAMVAERKVERTTKIVGRVPQMVEPPPPKVVKPKTSFRKAMERIENALPAPLPASHTFDRKAYRKDYMRKYMRKWRAEANEMNMVKASEDVIAMIDGIRASGLALPPKVAKPMDQLYDLLKEYLADDER